MSEELITSETGLIVRGEQELASVVLFTRKFDALLKVSSQFLKSGMLPASYKQPEQVAMVILKGRELGVSEFAALQGMYPVGANIGYTVQFILSMIRKHPQFAGFDYKFNPDEANPISCTVTMKRKHNDDWIEEKSWTFSTADAQKAGLVKPDSNYMKWMKNMLLSRATANCSRVIWSDIFSAPAYLTEELNPDMAIDVDVTDDNNYQKPPLDVFNSAKQSLEKAIKTLKIADLEAWKELYKDDVVKLPANLQGVLEREYTAAYNKIKPKVENANGQPKPEATTTPAKTTSTGTNP
jgi:hypothetical protein